MDFIQESLIDPVSNVLWNYLLIYVLVGAGLFFSFRTRFVQVRLFGQMVKGLRGTPATASARSRRSPSASPPASAPACGVATPTR